MPGNRQKIIIFLLPIVLIIIFILVKFLYPAFYGIIISEDHFVEYFQVFLYLISFISTLFISITFFRSRKYSFGIFYLVLSLALLFWTFDEISWGQRIFNISNTQYFETQNAQKEISIHNLNIFQDYLDEAYIILGFYGAFASFLIPGSIKNRSWKKLQFIMPDWYLSFYFSPVFMIYLFFGYISPFMVHYYEADLFRIGNVIIWRDQEPAELLLALGLAIFFIINSVLAANKEFLPPPDKEKQDGANG